MHIIFSILYDCLQLQSIGGSQVIITNDPRLTALGLSQYPPLPSNTDPSKIEEIRRTIYISNLDNSVGSFDNLVSSLENLV